MENFEWSLSLSGSTFQRMGAATENALTPKPLSGGIAHALSSFLSLTSDCGLVYSGELNLQDKHAQRHFNI